MFINPSSRPIPQTTIPPAPIANEIPASLPRSSVNTVAPTGTKRPLSPTLAGDEETVQRKKQKKDKDKLKFDKVKAKKKEKILVKRASSDMDVDGSDNAVQEHPGYKRKRPTSSSDDSDADEPPAKRAPVGSAERPSPASGPTGADGTMRDGKNTNRSAADKQVSGPVPTGTAASAASGPSHIGNGNVVRLSVGAQSGRPGGIPMHPPTTMPTAGPAPPRPRPVAPPRKDPASALFLGKKKVRS